MTRLYIPVLNLQLCRRYREKNVAVYLRKALELIDAQIAWAEKQILSEQTAPLCHEEKEQPSLKWTGSVVEWVEFIYALYLVKRINGGKITLKELFL
ncbi:MAG: RteC domain-containing protein, partial [Prevotellaceae bacterium]|nr:RteC domain-containing protein [Prevotellaceae bacterium]